MAERFYSGREDRVTVREDEQSRPLDPRLNLDRNGQTRFKWGREHTVGNRLAVALLADALNDDNLAVDLAKALTARVVVMLPERWTMSRARVLSFVDIIARESLTNLSATQQTSSAHAPIQSISIGTKNTTNSERDVGER
jgi:Family of unknown function (DUF6166)